MRFKEVIFLNGPLTLLNGTKIMLGKELAYDQIMLVICYLLPVNSPKPLASLDDYIRDCMMKANGILPNVENIRILFYDSIRQWCENHYYKPVKLFGDLGPNTTLVEIANAIQKLSDLISSNRNDIKLFFSGEQILINKKFDKELRKIAREIDKMGKIEVKLFSLVLKALTDDQLKY